MGEGERIGLTSQNHPNKIGTPGTGVDRSSSCAPLRSGTRNFRSETKVQDLPSVACFFC